MHVMRRIGCGNTIDEDVMHFNRTSYWTGSRKAPLLAEQEKEGGREREGLGLIPARLRAEAAGKATATVRSVRNRHGVDQVLFGSLGWRSTTARP